MYNVALSASGQDPVTSLRLSPVTIAKIFLGKISDWDDPAISADNGGVVLPNEHITVVCRTGQSGTTALFYDFVSHTDPTVRVVGGSERLLDRFPAPRSRQCGLADQHGVPVGLGHGGELHRRQPVDDRLRRARLRQGVQRQRRLGAERLGQLGATVYGEHQRRTAVGAARSRHLTGPIGRVHEHQPLGLPDFRLLLHFGPVHADFGASDLHLRLLRSGHREHAGPVHGLRRLRRPDPDGQHRLRPAPDTTVANPGERRRVDVGPDATDAERLELQQSDLQREPRSRRFTAARAPDRQFSRGIDAECFEHELECCGRPRAIAASHTAALASGSSGGSSGTGSAGTTAASGGTSGGAAKSAAGPSDTQPADPAALAGSELPTSSWVPLLALLIALAIPVVVLSINRKRRPS